MLKKRIIFTLTFNNGVLFRTKNFKPDYRYTKNFIDLWSVDELILIDVSKKKNLKKFVKIVEFFSNNCFVPITIGGGIKNIKDADLCFRNGAEKVLLGSASTENLNLIHDISKKYGNQSIIQSIDCIRNSKNDYQVLKNSGVSEANVNSIEWGRKLLNYGVGEILINNVYNDGGLLGYDLDLINFFSKGLDCPILALGGAGNWQHMLDLFKKTNVSAACTQNIYHFTEKSILSAKNYLQQNNIKIRN
jgi:imidazole glycerol-phosphate synthase subunit HisF